MKSIRHQTAKPNGTKPAAESKTLAEAHFQAGLETVAKHESAESFLQRFTETRDSVPKAGQPVHMPLAGLAGHVALSERECLEFIASKLYELRAQLQKFFLQHINSYERLLVLEMITLAEVICIQRGEFTDRMEDILESPWSRAAMELQTGQQESLS